VRIALCTGGLLGGYTGARLQPRLPEMVIRRLLGAWSSSCASGMPAWLATNQPATGRSFQVERFDPRPRQDSNLRHRLRRAIWFVRCIQLVKLSALELGLSSSQIGTVLLVVPS
jgi:hypothetical protein